MRGKKGTVAVSPDLNCAQCGSGFRPKYFRPSLEGTYRYCSTICAAQSRAANPDVRAKLRKIGIERESEPARREYRKKHHYFPNWTGRKHSEATKAKLSSIQKALYTDPELGEMRREKSRQASRTQKRKPSSITIEEKKIREKIKWWIHSILKRCRTCKDDRTVRILGYSGKDLRAHLESKWQAGMSWENHGLYGWHIDHIRPIASFPENTPASIINALENLQPLWWLDNVRKGSRYG